MSALWSILSFLIVVSILVAVHEFGHYWVARRAEIKVLRFSIGFGPPLLSWRGGKDQVEYSIAPIPLGGYVRMLDEREAEVSPEDLPRAFSRAHPLKRILVLFAGPGINFLFAIVLFASLLSIRGLTEPRPIIANVIPGSIAARAGLERGEEILSVNGTAVHGEPGTTLNLLDAVSGTGSIRLVVRKLSTTNFGATPSSEVPSRGRKTLKLVIASTALRRALTAPSALYSGLGFTYQGPISAAVLGKVLPGSPAAQAGLKPKDLILKIDGHSVRSFETFAALVAARPDRTIRVMLKNSSGFHTVAVHTTRVLERGRWIGRIGVLSFAPPRYPFGTIYHVHPGVLSAFALAAQQVWQLTLVQAKMLWRMLFGAVSPKSLSGPVTIASYAGQAAHDGLAPFLAFMAVLSLSLGLINLVPIPTLDGGQIVTTLIEWIKGSPLSETAQLWNMRIGFFLLAALVIFALANDVLNAFHLNW